MRTTQLLLLVTALAASPLDAQTVIFRDDFNGAALNQTLWATGNWTLGRTQLGNTPVIANGVARLTFDTYQFRGTEIYSKAFFARNNGVEFVARVKLNNLPNGLVCSLFTYAWDNPTSTSDELDIEILSKQVNLTRNGDPISFTTWNDWSEAHPTYNDGIHHWSTSPLISGLDVNQWHIYTIRWLPGRTEWLVDGVLVASTTKAQPDAATPVRLNFWAPASSWSTAYDAKLASVKRANANVRYYYDVDWVEVRQLP